MRPIQILLAEDNPADVDLMLDKLSSSKVRNEVHVVTDGVDAMRYLRGEDEFDGRVFPDLLLLDLNMPRKDGREVLQELLEDDALRTLPVVVLTSSEEEEDILRSYELNANCYVTKPVDLRGLERIVASIEDFWFSVVRLPPRES